MRSVWPCICEAERVKNATERAHDVVLHCVQTIGSWGFIISATMFCLEVQKHWWLPRPLNLGWQARSARFVPLAVTYDDS